MPPLRTTTAENSWDQTVPPRPQSNGPSAGEVIAGVAGVAGFMGLAFGAVKNFEAIFEDKSYDAGVGRYRNSHGRFTRG